MSIDTSADEISIKTESSPYVGTVTFYYFDVLSSSATWAEGFAYELSYIDTCAINNLVGWSETKVFSYDRSNILESNTISWQVEQHDDDVSLSMGSLNYCGTLQYILTEQSSTTG